VGHGVGAQRQPEGHPRTGRRRIEAARATASGDANVFDAFRSGPVSVSQTRTRVRVGACHSRISSRSASRSRFSISAHARPLAASTVTATSTNGTWSLRAKSARRPSALMGYTSDSTCRSTTRPRAYCSAHA
jgi:hypothetical protein